MEQESLISDLQSTISAHQERITELEEENSELKQVYQEQQEIIDRLNQERRDSGVGIDQYEHLAEENEKLKMQLGDMIDKYKILYAKIRELQEERQKERQIEAQKRAEQSINPFSLASVAARSTGGEKPEAGEASSFKQSLKSQKKPTEYSIVNHTNDSERGQNDIQRNQSGGSSGESKIINSKASITQVGKHETSSIILHSDQVFTSPSKQRTGDIATLQQQLRQLQLEKQEQEQDLIKAKVEWATVELECDRLRHELQAHQEREEQLAAEKYEESLKLSILEKRSEIDDKIKNRQKTPSIKKIAGKMFTFKHKKGKDMGCGESEIQGNSSRIDEQALSGSNSAMGSQKSGKVSSTARY